MDGDCNICVTDERVKNNYLLTLNFSTKFREAVSACDMIVYTLSSNRKLSRAGGTD